MKLLNDARVETHYPRIGIIRSIIIDSTNEDRFMTVHFITDPETGTSIVEFAERHWFPGWLQREVIDDIATYLGAEDAELLTPTPDDTTLVDDGRSIATL
jgi:hypothetical protein